MNKGRSTSRLLRIAIACLLIGLLVTALGGMASAKGKPDRPPGQGKKDTATVQLQDIDSGITSPTGVYRWRDIANQAYATSYRTGYDYTQATVKVSFGVADGVLQGKLAGRNLKPNFAYQVKLVGDPVGDADANERIGFAGRWWDNDTNANISDVQYEAVKDSHNVLGYMLFDYFITNGAGKASLRFQVDSSYHVLFETTQRPHTANDGPIKTATFDPTPTSKAYDTDYGPSTVGVYGQYERLPVGGIYPAPGSYTCQMILTEESFHGSGGTWAGSWAAAMGAPISFEIPAS